MFTDGLFDVCIRSSCVMSCHSSGLRMVGVAYRSRVSDMKSCWRIALACSSMDHGTRIVPVVGARSAVSRKNVETASSGRLIPSIGGTFCITHSRPRPVQELPTM